MQTTTTMRITSVREISVMGGIPTEVEMLLTEDSAHPAMEMRRVVRPLAEQRPVGTRYTVETTYTEIEE